MSTEEYLERTAALGIARGALARDNGLSEDAPSSIRAAGEPLHNGKPYGKRTRFENRPPLEDLSGLNPKPRGKRGGR